jgi:hypothetical protein
MEEGKIMLRYITNLIAKNEIQELKYFIYLLQDFHADPTFLANLQKLKGLLFVMMSRNELTLPDIAYKALEKAKQMFIDLKY